MNDPLVAMKHIQKLDWALASGSGIGSLIAYAIGHSSLGFWLALAAGISAVMAYLEPARKLVQYIQKRHMRSAR